MEGLSWRQGGNTLRDTVIRNASSDVPSHWKRSQRHAQVGQSDVMEQALPLPAWEEETSALKSSTASPLSLLEDILPLSH